MREPFGCDSCPRHTLDSIVANCCRGRQTLFDVSLLEDVPLSGRVSPETGKTVGLKFHSNRELVSQLRPGLLHLPHATLDSEQCLDVVTDLVRQHVRLREIARRTEPLPQLLVETKIDVHLPIAGTVKRSGCRLRESARGLDRVPKEHQLGALIPAAQQPLPRVLC